MQIKVVNPHIMRAANTSDASAGNVTLDDSKLQGKPEKLRLSEFYSKDEPEESSRRPSRSSPRPGSGGSSNFTASPTFYGTRKNSNEFPVRMEVFRNATPK